MRIGPPTKEQLAAVLATSETLRQASQQVEMTTLQIQRLCARYRLQVPPHTGPHCCHLGHEDLMWSGRCTFCVRERKKIRYQPKQRVYDHETMRKQSWKSGRVFDGACIGQHAADKHTVVIQNKGKTYIYCRECRARRGKTAIRREKPAERVTTGMHQRSAAAIRRIIEIDELLAKTPMAWEREELRAEQARLQSEVKV
jgi:hypothetical protein